MHDLEFGFTPGVHTALVCILYLMTCFLLAPMIRYSTCLHALCSLPFWALSCYNTGKIPYLLKSACKAAKLHGNILPDFRTLRRCAHMWHMYTSSDLSLVEVTPALLKAWMWICIIHFLWYTSFCSLLSCQQTAQQVTLSLTHWSLTDWATFDFRAQRESL